MASAIRLAGAKHRILIVEDEYLIAAETAAMLEDLGYEVVGSVPTIAEAMAAINAEHLDAVLLDVNLRGTNSAPIAEALAARGLPFVVATGYGNLELDNAALQRAPRIEKPMSHADLGAVLAKTVASHA